VLCSKFVGDLPFKAFFWIQCCVMVPDTMDLSSMNQCFMFVMANLITCVSVNVWTWS